MKLGASLKILVVFLTIVCLIPASAMARRGDLVIDPSSNMELRLKGSNGFGISLSASGGHVYLATQGHDAAVQYAASGVAEKGKIKAGFGALGRVALRFHPRGKAHLRKEPLGNCRGGDALVQAGVFVGRIDFEGEQGYTEVHSGRAKGTVIHTKKQVCTQSESEEVPPSAFKWTLVSAAAEENKVSFSAAGFDFKSQPGLNGISFGATIVEFPRPGFSIFRTIQAEGDPAAFSVVSSHHHIVEATVTPPAPFSGSATYKRAAPNESESWVGSLAGDFPGLGTVSLAGPSFCGSGIVLKACHGPSAWAVSFGLVSPSGADRPRRSLPLFPRSRSRDSRTRDPGPARLFRTLPASP